MISFHVCQQKIRNAGFLYIAKFHLCQCGSFGNGMKWSENREKHATVGEGKTRRKKCASRMLPRATVSEGQSLIWIKMVTLTQKCSGGSIVKWHETCRIEGTIFGEYCNLGCGGAFMGTTRWGRGGYHHGMMHEECHTRRNNSWAYGTLG